MRPVPDCRLLGTDLCMGANIARIIPLLNKNRKGFPVIRNLSRYASILGVVAVSSAALVACGDSAGEKSDSAAVDSNLSGETGELIAEGASSQQNAMEIFGTTYAQNVSGASLAYNPTGSGSGRTNFVAGTVDFAGSDSPLAEDQVAPAKERCGGNDAWHLPFVIGPVAIAYNLDGVEKVNLSVPTLVSIFKGDIKNWNDEAIAAENEGTDLPDQGITVVYRSDESGTSQNFQKFLATAGEWEGEGQQFPNAIGEGANGSNGVATQVANIPGAITYVEYGFALQNNLGVAAIDFGSGAVELNPENVNTALEGLEFANEGHDMVVDAEALFSQTQEGSYPLVLTTYEIVCSAGYDEAVQNRVKDFLTIALDNQEALAEIGFIPVEGTHHERLAAAVAAIGEGA